MTDFLVINYSIYIFLSIALTVWVARTLHKNGRVFLVDAFGGREELADSVNHLLVVGFYLVNIGFVALQMKTSDVPATTGEVFEMVATKVGIVLLVLGAMHFMNLAVFNRLRRRGEWLETLADADAPPVAPDRTITPVV